MNEELKQIKKYYGETMAKLCREYLPTFLEHEGLVFETLKKNFYNHRNLAADIISEKKELDFRNYIYLMIYITKEKDSNDYIYSKIKVQKKPKNEVIFTPRELLEKAGYELYKCETEEEIQSFKKWYKDGEVLCTFKGERLVGRDVFFAVKKDADKIERKETPKRQDEYGTSVISIQFVKGDNNTVSIKNRYNHIVNNPDATFGNNLDNIITGLTDSFEKQYGYNITNSNIGTNFELENYTKASDGKFYKYTQEIDGKYYCVDNIVIDGNNIRQYDKEKYLLIENYLIDLQEKTITDLSGNDNSFSECLKETNGIQIENKKDEENRRYKKITFSTEKFQNNGEIVINSDNEIVAISFPNVTTIGNNFLRYNKKVRELNLPNAIEIGNRFMHLNKDLSKVEMLNLKSVGDSFFSRSFLMECNFPNLITIGDRFLRNCSRILKITLPSATIIGDEFMESATMLKEIELSKVECVGKSFLSYNKILVKAIFFKLKRAGNSFLRNNVSLSELLISNVEYIEDIDTNSLESNLEMNKYVKQIIKKNNHETKAFER